ncbi:rhomboid family intramembrane serine protease [Haloarcula salinisoli]|uniref:Rhomboid family intramembrane serine protease n=1 Tax=Haloarcula salinisoli TaxID=2487746 RepID=A0A8J7YI68_9EURY|nr:rhomboid family intramembrane serine protease [Halomicroarcula salinisoli]MBX0286637.1 rhomboid family intramembrane serine protease [Halomicroarcula salinisoli]MBX0303948.1 rhomboid family intramembrane serine protease [Halomicroarcula salinisoli]
MRALRHSPTLVTLALILAVFACQELAGLLGWRGLFALSNPLLARPWTVVTSVYAHASVSHLVANALALALGGLLVERLTTSARFHAFFVAVGSLAGVTQVALVGVVGPLVSGMPAQVAVLGASGAILGLYGYLLGANRVTELLVAGIELEPRFQLALGVLLAGLITVLTANPGAALIAHFTGLLLGFLAGRAHLLAPGENTQGRQPTVE